MIFDSTEKRQRQKARFDAEVKKFSEWHDWFAWYPVKINHTSKTAWLETVSRRRILYSKQYNKKKPEWLCWEYKLK